MDKTFNLILDEEQFFYLRDVLRHRRLVVGKSQRELISNILREFAAASY